MTKQQRIAKIDGEAFGLIAKISALAIASDGAVSAEMLGALKRLKTLKRRLERLGA